MSGKMSKFVPNYEYYQMTRNNMKQLLTSLLLAFCFCMNAASTVIPDMKFRRLDTRDGLSNSSVNELFQDSKGVIWISKA